MIHCRHHRSKQFGPYLCYFFFKHTHTNLIKTNKKNSIKGKNFKLKVFNNLSTIDKGERKLRRLFFRMSFMYIRFFVHQTFPNNRFTVWCERFTSDEQFSKKNFFFLIQKQIPIKTRSKVRSQQRNMKTKVYES